MDSAAHPMQTTFRGRRKKTVRQGAQVVSVLSITARPLYSAYFLHIVWDPHLLADKRDTDGRGECTASEVSRHCLR